LPNLFIMLKLAVVENLNHVVQNIALKWFFLLTIIRSFRSLIIIMILESYVWATTNFTWKVLLQFAIVSV
jgi:hypothetical protein